MTVLMIACPKTGKPLATGIDAPLDQVKSGAMILENNSVGPCPHCGETHTWSGKDVLDEA